MIAQNWEKSQITVESKKLFKEHINSFLMHSTDPGKKEDQTYL